MRLKRAFVVFGACLLVTVFYLVYITKDFTFVPAASVSISQEYQDNKWLHFEDRLKQLENDLTKHHEAVGEMRQVMQQMLPSSSTQNSSIHTAVADKPKPIQPQSEMIYSSKCSFQMKQVRKTQISMLKLYEDTTFDNPNGGVWKQGWNIQVDEFMWNKQHKLKVFVVPHSHCDPGWIKTFEDYYEGQTKHILNNMLERLGEDSRRKFIWAEISFFAMWWDELKAQQREKVKKYLRNNQLEIVTGGWVMNDEANSHWVSILHQLTEGHQWLLRNLNYTPTTSWSIDPFGMSAAQPALLKGIGIENAAIQRVHYVVKRELAKKKQLEFRWRQTYDSKGETDVFTHLMPFYSYDIPHTCGPDPKICCQFDFARLPGYGITCPWRVPPQQITENNVDKKALLLLDQYRKKAQLYKTNVLLIPLGDDFRYGHTTEWDAQFNNYQQLFDYMNSNVNLHVQAQFGTLKDYFKALHADTPAEEFPSLSGDFFTYADRDDHYWSGYYTSRPFYKRMDRILLSYIRSAELILTLAHISGKPGSKWVADKDVGMQKSLTEARQALALFQHHDGVAGTSKDPVVNDYGQKMLLAILNCQNVIQRSVNVLLSGPGSDVPGSETIFYNIDDSRRTFDAIAEQHTITIGPELNTKKVVIFNSLAFTRHEVVTFFVSTPYIQVVDLTGKLVRCQISPVFEHRSTMSLSKYSLSFIANIPPMALVSYVITALTESTTPQETIHSKIKIYNQEGEVTFPRGFDQTNVEVIPRAHEFTIQNARVTASFGEIGLLKAMRIGVTTYPVHLDFVQYGARQDKERSGGYLFLPDETDPSPIRVANTIVNVIEGPIYSSVIVELPYIHHTVTLYNSTGADSLGLDIQNTVDISKTSNFEVAMRFETNIKSGDNFFTDINGHQILRRRRLSKLPLQANYYPMPTIAYIQDASSRFTIVTGSPLGCSSLRPGHLEVMQDRRLNQDDNLGMAQGVLDNKPTRHWFKVLLERKTHPCETPAEDHPNGFPSLAGHISSAALLNPLMRLLRASDDDDSASAAAYLHANSVDMGVDYALVSLRTGILVQGKEYVGAVLHRAYVDMCYVDRVMVRQFPISDGSVNLTEILPSTIKSKMNKATLSFLKVLDAVDVAKPIEMCPMDINAYVLHR